MRNFATEGVAGRFDRHAEGLTNAGQMGASHHCHIDDMEKQRLSSHRLTQFDRVPDGYPLYL